MGSVAAGGAREARCWSLRPRSGGHGCSRRRPLPVAADRDSKSPQDRIPARTPARSSGAEPYSTPAGRGAGAGMESASVVLVRQYRERPWCCSYHVDAAVAASPPAWCLLGRIKQRRVPSLTTAFQKPARPVAKPAVGRPGLNPPLPLILP
jgi:hypothetical protein